jgi:DNA-binding phage protein
MKNVKMPTSSSYLEYLISSLKDPQEAAAFIEAILEEKDPEPELLRSALQDVTQGLGRAKLSPEHVHQQLEQLDRLLSNSESKVIYSFARWLDGLGLKLTVTAKSAIGWRDISGTNAIDRLPSTSTEAANLKALLTQLQAVLETADDTVLPDADKANALEQVKLLAEAAQKPEPEKKTLGAKAIRFLQRIVGAVPTALPIAATLVTEFNKLVPAIAKLIGL